MKNMVKRLMAVVLLVCVLAAVFVPAVADAVTATSGKRYNIMLVIDGSGSLISQETTDPDGMRYELIGELMGILEDDGHNIGAIVFSGTESKSANPTAAEMNEGIMLNTGLLSLDGLAPDGSAPKSYLERMIIVTDVNKSPRGGTDIGTALKCAQEQLLEMQNKNGLESVVFLFTDGNTAFSGSPIGAVSKSRENQDVAVQKLYQNGIRVFGAFLNKGGKNDDTEMKRIVCNSNGISATSKEFQYSYVELQQAGDISQATTNFLKFLGYISPDDEFVIHYDDIHDSFTVPGIGVEEMNIRVYSPYGEKLPELDVKITQPDGSVVAGVAMKESRTYRVYKLIKPMAGLWNIDIKVPEGNKVGFAYSPVVSLFIDSLVETNPAPQDLHVNLTADFNCLLSQAGTVITDPAAYQGYTCALHIKNVNTGDVEILDVPLNTAGSMTLSKMLDTYGVFEVSTVFTCEEIVVPSSPVTLDLTNRTPVAAYSPTLELTCGLFQDKTADVDLTQLISDPEDGTNLKYDIVAQTCDADAFTRQGNIITLDNGKIGKNSITVRAVDSQGAYVENTINIESKNVTIWFVLLFIAVAILIAALVIKHIKGKKKPDGELSVSFDLPVDGKTHHVILNLDVPGVNTTNKTDLYKLMQNALRNEEQKIGTLLAGDILAELASNASGMSAVAISAVNKKKGKDSVGAIKVTHQKKSNVLYATSADYFVGDYIFSLEFKPNMDDQQTPFGDDPFADLSNRNQNSAPNPFGDLDDPFQVPVKKPAKSSRPAAQQNANPFDAPEKPETKKNPLQPSKKDSVSDDFELF